ncbi:MAG: iron-dicitrate transporter ATP-binding subunit [Chloroflexota bacterium]|jgi:iron complex transport system ATP-binding protein
MSTFLDIRAISVAYAEKSVLRDLSLTVPRGSFVVCIGPNGAGKSSLLKAIAGILPLEAGTIAVDGENIAQATVQQRARVVAMVPQSVVMPHGFTVREVVGMARYAFRPWYAQETGADSAVIEAAMEQCEVAGFADTLADRLSGGEQQRVAIARAVAQEPQLLLLDESTAHLDLHHQAGIFHIARRLTRAGVTVVAAMHDLNMAAANADTLILLDRGTLLAHGSPTAVMRQDLLEQVYRTPLVAVPRAGHALPLYVLPTSTPVV